MKQISILLLLCITFLKTQAQLPHRLLTLKNRHIVNGEVVVNYEHVYQMLEDLVKYYGYSIAYMRNPGCTRKPMDDINAQLDLKSNTIDEVVELLSNCTNKFKFKIIGATLMIWNTGY